MVNHPMGDSNSLPECSFTDSSSRRAELAFELLHIEIGEERGEPELVREQGGICELQQLGNFPRRRLAVADRDPHTCSVR
jgi:hypothetical protein